MTKVIRLGAFRHRLPRGWAITKLAEDQEGWACRLSSEMDGDVNCRGVSPHIAVANAIDLTSPSA